MSRPIGVSLAAGITLLLVASAVSAQQPGPPALYNRPNVGVGARPQLPPYLNLGGGNNDPAVQYFLRTIPEQERRANTQIYGALIGDLEQRALTPPPAAADADLFRPLPTTGHPVAFQNTAGYFPTTANRLATGTAGYQGPPRTGR
jgi:hypothetical protein